jgi:hypothetical protein
MSAQALEANPATELDRQNRAPIETLRIPERVTSSQAKLVYFYLYTRGTVTVDELGTALRMPKLTLFSILQTLGEYDLVVRDGDAVSTA